MLNGSYSLLIALLWMAAVTWLDRFTVAAPVVEVLVFPGALVAALIFPEGAQSAHFGDYYGYAAWCLNVAFYSIIIWGAWRLVERTRSRLAFGR